MKSMMMMMRSFSFVTAILFMVSPDVTVSQQQEECTLKCPDEAPCRMGHADFSDRVVELGETHLNGMHCDCPVGWTGVLCDKKYETCTDQSGHECYHGGQCIPGLIDKYGNEQLFCDCSNTHGADGTHYVGKYCETPFEQACNFGPDVDEDVFCVNGGECNPDFPHKASHPCLCDDGWEGFHCEFKAGTVPECTLECENGGVCIVGASTSSEAGSMQHIWSLQEVEDHMRCHCPPGVGGALCQFVGEKCGSDGTCLHGGKCVSATHTNGSGVSTTQHHCDCTEATDSGGGMYAGKYCEHKATVVCSPDDFNLFCTQGGTCKSNPIEGCSCPSGTAGFKCEFLLENLDNGSTGGDDDDDHDDDNDDDQPEAILCASGINGTTGVCKNGGFCFVEETLGENGDLTTIERCDCRGARTDTDIFDGPFCQYKVTSRCPTTDGRERYCVNHGVCQNDGLCECSSGWTGDHCEQPLPYDPTSDGNDGGLKCGNTICYNGGTCIETAVVRDEGTELLTHCDCSTAFDDTHLYGGESCQFKSTDICTMRGDGSSMRGSIFCTNHGTCNADNVHLGCDCPEGFTGFSCEFEHNGDSVEEEDDDSDGPDESWEICGDYGLVCHNGGKCVDPTVDQPDYTCNCTTAYNRLEAYLGLSCEYPATTICDAQPDGKPLSAAVFCVNHGTCKSNPDDGCSCPVGFTGDFCELKADVEDIINGNNEGGDMAIDRCGDHLVCLNGGVCVKTVVVSPDGEEREVDSCDCDVAFTETNLFAGPSCEYNATSVCATPNGDGIEGFHFCTNGGTCKENYLEGCDCPPAWHGFRCQFATGETDLPENDSDNDSDGGTLKNTCELPCKNGGVCAEGAKDLGDLDSVIGEIEHLNATFDQTHFAHCVCPEGWVGLTCDHKIEVCGENEHYCLHGSKCVQDETGKHKCDCAEADEVIGDGGVPVFAGDYCEHVATDICTFGEDYPGKPIYFCVNSGRCNAQVSSDQPDPGCSCGEDWTGPHCETRVSSSSSVSSEESASNVGLIIGSVIGVLLAILAVMFVSNRVQTKKKSTTGIGSASGTPFPLRRRRIHGYGGSPNLASTSSRPTNGTVSSSSDPVVAGFVLTPEDEPGSYDENDGVMYDGMTRAESFSEEAVLVAPPLDEDGNIIDSTDRLHSVDFV